MKFLSTQHHYALVIIQDREAIRFRVPVELAIMIFWFLANQQARLLVLTVWFLTRTISAYFAGWQEDLNLIRQALIRLVTDALTIQVARSFG